MKRSFIALSSARETLHLPITGAQSGIFSDGALTSRIPHSFPVTRQSSGQTGRPRYASQNCVYSSGGRDGLAPHAKPSQVARSAHPDTRFTVPASSNSVFWSTAFSSRTKLCSLTSPARSSSILRLCESSRAFSTTARRKADQEKHNQAEKPPASTSQHDRQTDTRPSSHPQGHNYFMDRLPHMPHLHRPTKEELLAAATGFWSRLKIRFKWFSIRSTRPFNIDEISGFLSWLLVGHVIWIVLGTTTFFSLAILTINTIAAQETLASWIGNYLTKSTGVMVVFESAVVPKWGDGVITFKNVFVSRRPGQKGGNVKKGSQEIAAAAAAATAKANNRPDTILTDPDEDTNYTQFDVTIDEVNVTLSFTKWFNSKGLLEDVEVVGVRGVIDRTNVHWTGQIVDPKSFRHKHNPGDFELGSFKLKDLLVTVHQPKGFRPFPISIYEADLPQLRKQWLLYDFLSANSMSGEIDHSLFTIHPRQTHSLTGARLENDDGTPQFKKQSRIRVDSLNIDHLNRGVEGPFGWIHEGNVDIVADIMFPAESDESLAKVMADFYDRLEATVTSNRYTSDPAKSGAPGEQSAEDKRYLIMDLRVHLNDVRASVPLFTRDLSYVNNALVRPIVAYINSRRTFIPINCRVVKRVSDFDGSWTTFDSGLMDDLSAEVYDAFARDVSDDQARLRRFKKVGLWSLQLAAQAIFLGMAGASL